MKDPYSFQDYHFEELTHFDNSSKCMRNCCLQYYHYEKPHYGVDFEVEIVLRAFNGP